MNLLLKQVIEEVNKASVWPSTEEYNQLLAPNYEFVHDLIHDFAPSPNINILDVGTAYGVLAIMNAKLGSSVMAIDNTDRYTSRKLFDKYKIDFCLCDFEKTDIPVKEQDLVIFTEVLEHLNYNPLKPMKRIADTLKQGGLLILTTPRFETQGFAPGRWGTLLNWRAIPTKGKKQVDEHTHHYSQPELFSLLNESGFEVINCGECYNRMSHYFVAKKK